MTYEVIKIIDMGRGENNYRVLGRYKTIVGAQRMIEKAKQLHGGRNVSYRIDEER
jgi:hypothetical protein